MTTTINRTYVLEEQTLDEIRKFEESGFQYRPLLHLLANQLHLSWQEGAKASGLKERWKDIKKLDGENLKTYLELHRETTRKGDKLFQVNILALENSELPPEHQEENLRSAAHAIGTWHALLASFDTITIKKNIDVIKRYYHHLGVEHCEKELDEPGGVSAVLREVDNQRDSDALGAIFEVASKIHDAWIHRATWLEPSSIQARPFYLLNNYNQRADLNIIFALSEIKT